MADDDVVEGLSGGAKINPVVNLAGEVVAIGFRGTSTHPAMLKSSSLDVVDGVGSVIDTASPMAASGVKLLSVRTGGVEKAYIDKDGNYVGGGVAPSSYGGCYEFNESGSNIVMASSSSVYRWITGQAGTVKGAGYVTWNDAAAPTGKRLTIGASGAGVYQVTCSCSGTLDKAADLDVMIAIGDTVQNNIRADQSVATQAKYQTASVTGILTLAAGDTVTLWFGSDTASTTLTVKHVNMTLVRIG